MSAKLLLCFDGSEGAGAAIAAAARLFPGAEAVVAHAWRRPRPYGAGYVWVPQEIQSDVDRWAQEKAEEIAAQGVTLARAAGLEARGDALEASGPAWQALLGAAESAGAEAVVCGSRGHGAVHSALLGSTSQALGHHAKLPLVIVPPSGEE